MRPAELLRLGWLFPATKPSPDVSSKGAHVAKRALSPELNWNDQQQLNYQILWPVAQLASTQPVLKDDDTAQRIFGHWDTFLALQSVPDVCAHQVISEGRLSHDAQCDDSCLLQHIDTQSYKVALCSYVQSHLITLGADFAGGHFDDTTGQVIAHLSTMAEGSEETAQDTPANPSRRRARSILPRQTPSHASSTFLEALLRGDRCVKSDYLCTMAPAKLRHMGNLLNAFAEEMEPQSILKVMLTQMRNGTTPNALWKDIGADESLPPDWKSVAGSVIAKEVENTQLLASTATDFDPDTDGVKYTEFWNGEGRLNHPNLLEDTKWTATMDPGIKAMGYRMYISQQDGMPVARQPRPGMLQSTASGQWAGFNAKGSAANTTTKEARSERPLPGSTSSNKVPRNDYRNTRRSGSVAPGTISGNYVWNGRHWASKLESAMMRPIDGPAGTAPGYDFHRTQVKEWHLGTKDNPEGTRMLQARRNSGAQIPTRGSVGTAADSLGNPVIRALDVQGAASGTVSQPVMLDTVLTPIKDSTKLQIHNVNPSDLPPGQPEKPPPPDSPKGPTDEHSPEPPGSPPEHPEQQSPPEIPKGSTDEQSPQPPSSPPEHPEQQPPAEVPKGSTDEHTGPSTPKEIHDSPVPDEHGPTSPPPSDNGRPPIPPPPSDEVPKSSPEQPVPQQPENPIAEIPKSPPEQPVPQQPENPIAEVPKSPSEQPVPQQPENAEVPKSPSEQPVPQQPENPIAEVPKSPPEQPVPQQPENPIAEGPKSPPEQSMPDQPHRPNAEDPKSPPKVDNDPAAKDEAAREQARWNRYKKNMAKKQRKQAENARKEAARKEAAQEEASDQLPETKPNPPPEGPPEGAGSENAGNQPSEVVDERPQKPPPANDVEDGPQKPPPAENRPQRPPVEFNDDVPPAEDLTKLAKIEPAEVLAPKVEVPTVEGAPVPPQAFSVEDLEAVARPAAQVINAEDAAQVAVKAGVITATEAASLVGQQAVKVASILAEYLGTIAIGLQAGLFIYSAVEIFKPEPHCPRPSIFTEPWDEQDKTMLTLRPPCASAGDDNYHGGHQGRAVTMTTVTVSTAGAAVRPAQRRDASPMTAAAEDAMHHDPKPMGSAPVWNPTLRVPGMPTAAASTCISKTFSEGYTTMLMPGFPCAITMPLECTDENGRFMAIKLRLRTQADSMVKPKYCVGGDLTGHRQAEKDGCVPDFDSQECIDRWLDVPAGTKAVHLGEY